MQNFFAAAISGGLPPHDFFLDGQGFENFDELLLPSFMKTLELKESLGLIKRSSLFDKDTNHSIGNPNWQLWLKNMWENSSKEKLTYQIKYIFSCLSGNPNQIMNICPHDYYEIFYAHINCLLNKKFYDKFLNEKYVDYSVNFFNETSTDEEEIQSGTTIIRKEFPNIKCLEIQEILDSSKNNDLYQKVSYILRIRTLSLTLNTSL